MKDEELENIYCTFSKFYLAFISKSKLKFDPKEFDETFHLIMSKNENYDKDQVDRIIYKK